MKRSERQTGMDDEKPLIESRRSRLIAYVAHNKSRILVDALLLATWITLVTGIFTYLWLPRSIYYIALFLGVLLYSLVTHPWERPFRSPD